MKHIELNNTTYGFTKGFKHNKGLRTSFNELTEGVFGFSMEEWYRGGYWGDKYVPYSLLHENKIVANVSISIIEFIIADEKKSGIQIGTVMTDQEYRNRGLSKFLMEQVLEEWKEKADFMYLFANDSVLDFYPKFNFEAVDQYQYSQPVNANNDTSSVKRLNIEETKEKDFLRETLKTSIPISRISMYDNASLIMFYCLSIKKNSIYYIDALKAVVVADFEGDTLYLNDVFSKEQVDLNEVVQSISGEEIKSVVLGFTPLNDTGYNKSLLKEEDMLFVLKGKADYLKDNHWMFPVLSHA